MVSSSFARLKVSDLMAGPTSLPETSSVREAAMFLAHGGTPVLPVMSSDGTLTGVFGEAEIHRRLSEVTRGFHAPEEFRTGVPFLAGSLPDTMWDKLARVGWLPVSELRREIRPVRPDDSISVSLEAMRGQGLSALPVLEEGELVGVLHADALTLRLMEFALMYGVRRTRGPKSPRRAHSAPGP